MNYHESKGKSLKDMRDQKRKENLNHLRIYAHEEGTPESPRWLIEHHSSENDSEPSVHEFDSGKDALAHIGQHASMSEEESEA